MASLFISYSRKNIESARKLTAAFHSQDLDFWIDWEGIPPTVDWWQEIEKGIEGADIFLFLISPDSCRSKVCKQEIEHAVKNGKRLIPLVVCDINPEEAPAELSHLNWIFVRETDDFNLAFQKLTNAIKTDYAWVQAHRELQVKALEWEKSGHENSFLLFGKELQEAEHQLATNTSKEPHPTDLQREYVHKSRKAVDRRRARNTGITTAGLIVLATLAVFGFVQAGQATSQARIAETEKANAEANLVLANDAIATAQSAQSTAIANADAAAKSEAMAKESAMTAIAAQTDAENALKRVQSVSELRGEALAKFSREVADRDPSLSLLLALEGYKTATNPQTISRLIEVLGESLVVRRFESRFGVYAMAFNPSGGQLAVGYNNKGNIELWNVDSEKRVTLTGHQESVYGLVFSPNGQTLVSGALDGQIIFWDLRARQKDGRALDGFDTIFAIDFSPDGSRLAASGKHQKITVWDTVSRQRVTQSSGHTGTVFGLEFSPDGKLLASAGKDKTLIFWDAATLQMLGKPIRRHSGLILNLTFSRDGKTLATADDSGMIYLWDVETRKNLGEAIQASATNRISSIAFSPDGKWLASGSYDGRVILWDVETHQQGAHLPIAGTSEVYSVVFSPDGSLLAVGDKSGAVTLWNMAPALWVKRACDLAERNFTQAELLQYFPGEVNRPPTCDQFPTEG